MFVDEKHVKVDGLVIWDGISKPEKQDDGSLKHNLKIAVPGTAPEIAELQQLATNALNGTRFNGVLPPGANWPLKDIDVTKFGDTAALVTDCITFNAGTSRGVPEMFDVAGTVMPSMANYAHVLYAGAKVSIIVHAYDYGGKETKGNTGVSFGLDGIMILDATTPKLDVGAGLSSAAVAAGFGVGAAPAPAPVAVAPAPVAVAPVAPVAAPVAPVAAPVAPVAAPAPAGPVMTAKAAGTPYETFTAGGWTHEQLIANGYVEPGGPAPAPGFLIPPGV